MATLFSICRQDGLVHTECDTCVTTSELHPPVLPFIQGDRSMGQTSVFKCTIQPSIKKIAQMSGASDTTNTEETRDILLPTPDIKGTRTSVVVSRDLATVPDPAGFGC